MGRRASALLLLLPLGGGGEDVVDRPFRRVRDLRGGGRGVSLVFDGRRGGHGRRSVRRIRLGLLLVGGRGGRRGSVRHGLAFARRRVLHGLRLRRLRLHGRGLRPVRVVLHGAGRFAVHVGETRAGHFRADRELEVLDLAFLRLEAGEDVFHVHRLPGDLDLLLLRDRERGVADSDRLALSHGQLGLEVEVHALAAAPRVELLVEAREDEDALLAALLLRRLRGGGRLLHVLHGRGSLLLLLPAVAHRRLHPVGEVREPAAVIREGAAVVVEEPRADEDQDDGAERGHDLRQVEPHLAGAVLVARPALLDLLPVALVRRRRRRRVLLVFRHGCSSRSRAALSFGDGRRRTVLSRLRSHDRVARVLGRAARLRHHEGRRRRRIHASGDGGRSHGLLDLVLLQAHFGHGNDPPSAIARVVVHVDVVLGWVAEGPFRCIPEDGKRTVTGPRSRLGGAEHGRWTDERRLLADDATFVALVAVARTVVPVIVAEPFILKSSDSDVVFPILRLSSPLVGRPNTLVVSRHGSPSSEKSTTSLCLTGVARET